MIAVGICTAPRPTCYLQDTIDSLQAAGLYPSVICQDGGNYDNWVKMARKLLNRRAEFLMTCEDDITIREDALRDPLLLGPGGLSASPASTALC